MLTKIAQNVIDWLGSLTDIVNMLPRSPFERITEITVSQEVLGAIAWVVPFNAIIALLEVWGFAVAGWYVASKILRWIKVVE